MKSLEKEIKKFCKEWKYYEKGKVRESSIPTNTELGEKIASAFELKPMKVYYCGIYKLSLSRTGNKITVW